MTRHRLEHAVVMDTDDIPGRGGYAVVGISRGVSQAERLFVAQNFGISDFLHDPQNDRTFYSFFRVPGGRRAFTRRFANGRRRNGTQNRLFVHTLFFDESLLDGLGGLPWLLLEANVRAEGTDDWQPLRAEIPWLGVDGALPALEADIDERILDDVPRRINARLGIAGKEVADAPAAAAAVIGALRDQKRVVLPQGRGYEWLTLLAWSMLPRRDRDDLAWTQHDTLNITGVVFHLANVVAPAAEPGAAVTLDRGAPPIAQRIVQRNTAAPELWRDFHESALRYGLSVRRSEVLQACLDHRDAIRDVAANIGRAEAELVNRLTSLSRTGKQLRGQPCFQGEGILELLWSNTAVLRERLPSLLRQSGLDEVIFADAPDRRWLDRAAREAGAGAVVEFFLRCTDDLRDGVAARNALAEWVVGQDANAVGSDRLARVVVRAYADGAKVRRELLEQLARITNGIAALRQAFPPRAELPELAYDATLLAADGSADEARLFVREVLVRHAPAVGAKIPRELAERIAPLLRDDPDAFLGLQTHLAPEVRVRLTELVTSWLSTDPATTLPLARAVIREARDATSARALALGLARAGEPARVWFGVLLHIAAAIDAKDDATATRAFIDDLRRIDRSSVQWPGAAESLHAALEQTNARAGAATRALLLFARPAWKPQLVGAVTRALGRTYGGVAGWSEAVAALAADFAATQQHRADVSELVVEFWQKVPPEDLPRLPRGVIDAIAHVSGTSRKRLADVWQTRVRRMPETEQTAHLLDVLFGGTTGGAARELRVPLAWREIEHGIATEATLNRLDAALYDTQGARYTSEMAAGILKYIGDGGAVSRVRKLCELLRSPRALPTVKRIIEANVLPHVLSAMTAEDWAELTTRVRDDELFCRGPATLTIAFALGMHAGDSAVTQFESACRAHRRADAADSMRAGRRGRGLGQRLSQWWSSSRTRPSREER